VINRAININNVVDVQINCIPDGLQCGNILVLINNPGLITCAEPLLIGWDKLPTPVIVIVRALREVTVSEFPLVLTTFTMATLLLSRWYIGIFNFDCQLKGRRKRI
jgi:hypothetical protein